MDSLVIIPARMKATRLPDKPLKDIGGISMIARVFLQAQKAQNVRVVIASGDQEIKEALAPLGAEVVLTDPNLPSGSDRVRAALSEIDPNGQFERIINLQGDMPFVDPALINACIDILTHQPKADMATLVAPELLPADRQNPDVVKAVLAQDGRALYFTRSTLYGDAPIWRHIGIYGYRRAALDAFCLAPPSPLEQREKLEQLRALELGLAIYAAKIEDAPLSVDTPQDLADAIAFSQKTRQ